MHFLATVASLLIGSRLAIATSIERATTQLVNSTACGNVHIMIARGTTESYPGSLETLAELITGNNDQTTYENIIYPATDETTTNSYHIGKKAVGKQLADYVKRCENTESKLVVLAYSQVRTPNPTISISSLSAFLCLGIYDCRRCPGWWWRR